MQRLEVSGVVRPIYGTTHIWVVRRQTVKRGLIYDWQRLETMRYHLHLLIDTVY